MVVHIFLTIYLLNLLAFHNFVYIPISIIYHCKKKPQRHVLRVVPKGGGVLCVLCLTQEQEK